MDANLPLDTATLEARLGVAFHDPALLRRALTHHSVVPEGGPTDTYDRLEFFGDALIGAEVVEHLYHTHPRASSGDLTALKSEIVSRRVLARVGVSLDLMSYIQVDAASLRTFNERSRESLCADVYEALVAAIYLDQGRDAACAFVAHTLLPLVPEIVSTRGQANPKGTLQSYTLRVTGQAPHYVVLAESGEQNDRQFTVGAYVGDRLLAQGTSSSIKDAGREAARMALSGDLPALLGLRHDDAEGG
jgi:ribonuclease III